MSRWRAVLTWQVLTWLVLAWQVLAWLVLAWLVRIRTGGWRMRRSTPMLPDGWLVPSLTLTLTSVSGRL